KGNKVYIYRDACVDASYPAQSGVRAVVTNLDEMHAPAHLLTVEAVENRTDGGLTILCEEGGLRLTVPAKASVSPLTTKNIVTLADLHIGTQFFAWYDVVAESYPAQAGTERVVLLPPEDCTVGLVVEDDMAIWGGGRIENGAAVVPVRAVAEALGYTVYWNGSLQRVTLKKEGRTAALIQLGQDRYALGDGGSGISLGAAAYEVDGTTWVSAELFSRLHHSVELRGDTLHIDAALCGYPPAAE
ncbi:MAG: stalk domain-containing protein, partial [Agathobaculum sp.]|uniref:stalk domain-containing protein n=1 Tax=Agathobaculum sp. TaxID=2048138 RepID=UPI003D8E2C2C